MKPQHKHTTAARFLGEHALPSEDEIDAMSPTELAKFLADNGVDVAKLNAENPKLESQLKGKMTLAWAKQARRKKAETPPPSAPPPSQDEMIAALVAKYGRIENIPLAARNFAKMTKDDWASLYADLILRGK
jgi:hypothetical protein